MKTQRGLVTWAENHIGVHYLYGFKMEEITQRKLDFMVKTYPKYYSGDRPTKARNWIGQIATDCSGLLSSYTNIIRSSQGYHDTALYRIPYTENKKRNIFGLACWKQGHIGIGAGKGLTIEAKGFDYGVCKTKDTNWTELLYIKGIDYTPTKTVKKNSAIASIIWLQDRLNVHIGAGLEVDGIYGRKTAEAVLTYRRLLNKYHKGMTGKTFALELVNIIKMQ